MNIRDNFNEKTDRLNKKTRRKNDDKHRSFTKNCCV